MLQSLLYSIVFGLVCWRVVVYFLPRHDYVINVFFGVPGSGKTTFAAYLTKWCNHEAAPIRAARYFTSAGYITRCTLFCSRLQWAWHCFCSERGIEDLTAGYVLSGILFRAAMFPSAAARWLLEDTTLFKRQIAVYSNVPITGAAVLDAKADPGKVMIARGKVIIDEAGVEFNNRNFKSFSAEAIYFFKYHRHYELSVDVFSQSFEDMDVTIRRLARNFYVVRKSLVPNFILVRKIIRRVGIDQQTHQITDQYDFGIPVLDSKWVYCPPLWRLFNTYSRKDLPVKDWEQW